MKLANLRSTRPELFTTPKEITSKRRQIAKILSEDIEGHGIERSAYIATARRIKNCRKPFKARVWDRKAKKKVLKTCYTRACKRDLCPYCQTQKAKQDFIRLYNQFEAFDPASLWTIRLTLDADNVRGDELFARRQLLRDRFDKLTRQAEWQVFVRSGGAIHDLWWEGDAHYSEGYYVHLHLICAARRKPKWKGIKKAIRRTMKIRRRALKDCLFYRPVKDLAKKACYITRTCNLIPGYPKPSKGYHGEREEGPWLLPQITDEDITASRKARFRRQRVFLKNADRAIAQYLRKKREGDS